MQNIYKSRSICDSWRTPVNLFADFSISKSSLMVSETTGTVKGQMRDVQDGVILVIC